MASVDTTSRTCRVEAAGGSQPRTDGVWPLVGRADELAVARRTMAAVGNSGVMFVGPPGVGKTRLAREVVEAVAAAGGITCWVAATAAAATLPLGAFTPLLPALSGVGRVELLRRATDELLSRGQSQPLVLGVDDAHLLDETSTALVHQLASTRAATIVLTVRRGAGVSDSITSLWKDELVHRLEVAPLSRAESNELLQAALGGQVDGATQHELFDLTVGNVLFLRELVRGGLADGALRLVRGVWRWNGPVVAPQRLRELVAARIGHLDSRQRASMELVAYGEPLSLTVLQYAGVALTELDELERAGLLRSEIIGQRIQIRLGHPLYGEALRAATPALRAIIVNRELADACEAVEGCGPSNGIRIVGWRLAAGEPCDPQLLTDAGRQALATSDPNLTERLARAGLAAGAGFAARYLLAAALARQGHSHEADAAFADLSREAREELEAVDVLRVVDLGHR